jgi:hypothetical protein
MCQVMSNLIARHPLILLSLSVFLLVCLLWCMHYRQLKGYHHYCMDPQDNLRGPYDLRAWRLLGRTFEPILERYFDLAKTIIGLSAGSIAVIAGFLGYAAKNADTFVSAQGAIKIPVFLFAFSIVLLTLFLAYLAIQYEGYLVHPESYQAKHYATTLTLGESGIFCFAVGYFWLAWKVVSIHL